MGPFLHRLADSDKLVMLVENRAASSHSSNALRSGGCAGEKLANAALIVVEMVRKNPDQIGFAVQPRRWVVERFFAWSGRNPRLAKDFEASIESVRAFLYPASDISSSRIANAS